MFKLIILLIMAFQVSMNYVFRHLNLGQPNPDIPDELGEHYTSETLQKSHAYYGKSSGLSLIEETMVLLLTAVFLFSPLFSEFVQAALSVSETVVWQGLFFFGILFMARTFLSLPFEWRRHFQVEEEFGFNRMTKKLFWMDAAKSLVLELILMGLLLGLLLWLAGSGLEWWYMVVWAIWFFFSVVLSLLYPILIAPLFNKFEALGDEELETRIRELMEKAGLRLKSVYRMDASRRSSHGNAYFTGLGSSKRIVLFDSLLEKHTHDEICAVLAHEAGHWKHRHVLQRLLLSTLISLVWLGVLAWFLKLDLSGIGLEAAADTVWLRLWFFSIAASPVAFLMAPLGNWLSRRHEREADTFAVQLTGRSGDLIKALSRLSSDNLGWPNPHPLVWHWNYSHPPLLVRIASLRALGKKTSAADTSQDAV